MVSGFPFVAVAVFHHGHISLTHFVATRIKSTAPRQEMGTTVAETKAELRRRGVKFSSKLRKQELLDPLQANWDLPVLPGGEDIQPKKSAKSKERKLKNWKSNEPVRRLLYFEFKEGNLPLDPHEMGPAEVFCKFHNAPELEGIEYDEVFVQRLKSLREQISKEEPLLKWNEHHPARSLLFNELENGEIPVDAEEMGPAQVWCKYAGTKEFKMRGMKFNDTFKRRLVALRKLVARDKCRARDDLQQLIGALNDHPPPIHNHRGEPQWNGSKAQSLLKEAVDRGHHIEMEPSELRRTKPEFMECALNTFRWHIHQEVKTRKCLHTLEYDAEQKLRKHLGKMTIKN